MKLHRLSKNPHGDAQCGGDGGQREAILPVEFIQSFRLDFRVKSPFSPLTAARHDDSGGDETIARALPGQIEAVADLLKRLSAGVQPFQLRRFLCFFFFPHTKNSIESPVFVRRRFCRSVPDKKKRDRSILPISFPGTLSLKSLNEKE